MTDVKGRMGSARRHRVRFGDRSAGMWRPAPGRSFTLGLLSIRRLDALKASAYIVAQLAGGLVAYAVFSYVFGQKWSSGAHFQKRGE